MLRIVDASTTWRIVNKLEQVVSYFTEASNLSVTEKLMLYYIAAT